VASAAAGLVLGVGLVFLLFYCGPTALQWAGAPTNLALEPWVVYVCLVGGGGFGAVGGALAGVAGAVARAAQARRAAPAASPPSPGAR
jgi:hypothetical protein